MRPLISTGDPKKSVDISRKAELYETSSGMITITGGKLTTWRRMAKMAVDRLVEREARDAPCRTHEIPLGQPSTPTSCRASRASRRRPTSSSPAATATPPTTCCDRRRARRARPADRRRRSLDLLAEAVHAARREQARSVGDVLLRRTRLGLTAARQVARTRAHGRARRRRDGARAGLGRGAHAQEVQRFLAEARAEGIVAP